MSLILFSLTEDQYKLVLDFKAYHDCKYKNEATGFYEVGAIGGATTYRFTPTSLGVAAVVSCACGKEMDLTNYDEW